MTYLHAVRKARRAPSEADGPVAHERHVSHEGVMLFGKHEGKTVAEVAQNDPSYLEWALANVDELSACAAAILTTAHALVQAVRDGFEAADAKSVVSKELREGQPQGRQYVGDDGILVFGKHRGKTVAELAERPESQGYLRDFMLEKLVLSPEVRTLIEDALAENGVGSAKGEELGSVEFARVFGTGFKTDPDLIGATVTIDNLVVVAHSRSGLWVQPEGGGNGLLVTGDRARTDRPEVGSQVSVRAMVQQKEPSGLYATGHRSVVRLVETEEVTVHGAADLAVPETLDAYNRPPPGNNWAVTEWWRQRLGKLVSISAAQAISSPDRYTNLFGAVPEGWQDESTYAAHGAVIRQADRPGGTVVVKYRAAWGSEAPVMGAQLTNLVGVVKYENGGFAIASAAHELPPDVVNPEPLEYYDPVSIQPASNRVRIMNLNGENMDAADEKSRERMEVAADRVIYQFEAPEVVALQEVSGNPDFDPDRPVPADQTLQAFCELLNQRANEAGIEGADYRWFDFPPMNNHNGGKPGANVRNAFVVRVDRVRVDEDALEAVGQGEPGFRLSRPTAKMVLHFEPEYPDDTQGEPERLVVYGDHFKSMRGTPPWTTEGEVFSAGAEQRTQQAEWVLADAERELEDGRLTVVIVGDQNSARWGEVMQAFTTTGALVDLTDTIPEGHAYDYFHPVEHTAQMLSPAVGGGRGLAEGWVQMTMDVGHHNLISGRDTVKDSDHDHAVVAVDFTKPRER